MERDSFTHHGPSSAYSLISEDSEIRLSDSPSFDFHPESSSSDQVDPSFVTDFWDRHLPKGIIPNMQDHQAVLDIFFW